MSRNEDMSEKGGKEAATAATRVDSIDSEHPTPADEASSNAKAQGKWTRSLFRFGPLSGIFCMLLALASIIASLGILAGSDGRNIENWTTPPSTYLAIFTALANLSVRYAAVQGVVVAWWMRAMKGSTLAKLQYDWRAGSSLHGALIAGRNMGLLGLACIFSILVVIDGPLLQRASTVARTEIKGQPLPLSVVMAPELPRGSTGYWIDFDKTGAPGLGFSIQWNHTVPVPHGTAPNNISADSWNIWNGRGLNELWYNDLPLKDVVSGCPDKCKAKIRAPALFQTVDCTRKEMPLNYVEDWDVHDWRIKESAPPLETYEFLISANLVLDGKEKIALNTAYTVVEDDARHFLKRCNTTIVFDSCLLEAGIGEYDVHIQANEITMSSLAPPRMVAMANNSDVEYTAVPDLPIYASTLGGVVAEFGYRWGSFVTAWKPPHGQAQAYTYTTSFSVIEYERQNTLCTGFHDPRADVMASINKLMFYMGALAGKNMPKGLHIGRMDPGWSVHATVDGYPEGEQDVFRTHYAFFIAAAMVELVCVLLIAPTYWGWWRLGRQVSFSPLQIAKAFEAPLLSNANSNSSDRKLAQSTEDCHVKYGVMPVRDGDAQLKIAFGDPSYHHIAQPQLGQQFRS